MNQGRRRRQRQQDPYAAYRRPGDQAPEQTAEDWDDAPPEEPPQPSWNEETVWDDEPVEPQYDNDAYFVPEHETRQIIATNRAIRLSCTLAAMMGLFALFLCFAEQESRAIRRFAVQSAALSATAVASALVMVAVTFTIGSIPLMGFVVTLLCWLVYIGLLVVLIVIRVRMMVYAWRGVSFRLPLLDAWLEKKFM